MAALEQYFRLANEPGSFGLSCHAGGVSLAGVPLLRKSAKGFAPRPTPEIDALMQCAYGSEADAIKLTRGLDVVAEALNRGDLGRAMIGAVHLRLDELSFGAAARIARADDALAKFDPNELRDDRGRWTTGVAGPSARNSTRAGRTRAPLPTGPADQQRDAPRATAFTARPNQEGSNPSAPERSLNAPTHLYGGQIIPVQGPGGIGGNGPPPEFAVEGAAEEQGRPQARMIQGAEPASPRVGFIPGDPHFPMYDGVWWPYATHDLILQGLTGKNPRMVIFVPLHGDGPVLTGPERDEDYPCPEDYLPVTLIGIPQVTRPIGRPSFHAHDSVDEALALAKTNQFGTIYFNREFSTLTNGEVKSRIRPDVVGVSRPDLNLEQIYHPVEVLSPGQQDPVLRDRFPQDPRIKRDRPFKPFRPSSYQRSPYFIYFDTPPYEA